MKNRKILRNTFTSVAVLLVLTQSLTAETRSAVSNSSEHPFALRNATFITFDIPDGINGVYCQALSPAGVIAGTYVDENFLFHGFVRAQDGTITGFDVPGGVITQIGGRDLFTPGAMNPAGAITGTYFDENGVGHAFVRAQDGSMRTFDAPGAVAGSFAEAINSSGVVTGSYEDSAALIHGFLRTADGNIITFDSPGALFTAPSGINARGDIVGEVVDANGDHGFVRSRTGKFDRFDVSGAVITQPNDINAAGMITGEYRDESFVYHGFVRATNGTVAAFDPPGSTLTFAGAINAAGTVTGYYIDNDGVPHGFVRVRNGDIEAFDVPNSTGTLALAINSFGLITGTFFDHDGVAHGFVRLP